MSYTDNQAENPTTPYWRGEFKRIKFERDEQVRARLIKDSYAAALRLGICFEVDSAHPHLAEVEAVFKQAGTLRVVPVQGYHYVAPLGSRGTCRPQVA